LLERRPDAGGEGPGAAGGAQGDGGDEVLRLAHPIYRAVLRSTMPVGRRREVCEQLAEALIDPGLRGPTDLLRSAVWQLEAGTPPDRRRVSFAAAARRALQDDDPALAERLARAGLDGPAGEGGGGGGDGGGGEREGDDAGRRERSVAL